jgi:hypothetical protein
MNTPRNGSQGSHVTSHQGARCARVPAATPKSFRGDPA